MSILQAITELRSHAMHIEAIRHWKHGNAFALVSRDRHGTEWRAEFKTLGEAIERARYLIATEGLRQ